MTLETHKTNLNKKAKPRRWFRFRLRTLLIVVTLLSVTLGWVGWEFDQRRKEKVTIDWIEDMGGLIFYFSPNPVEGERKWWENKKDRWFGERVRAVDLKGKQVAELLLLVELKDLQRFSLKDTCVTDLSPLAGLRNLELVYVCDTNLTDLSPLAGLENLTGICLIDTNVTDLSPLEELKNLQQLQIFETNVTDLSPLTKLKNLKKLHLCHTRVTDLSPLAELNILERLDLTGTPVSDEQVQELRLALPNCKIVFGATGR